MVNYGTADSGPCRGGGEDTEVGNKSGLIQRPIMMKSFYNQFNGQQHLNVPLLLL